MDNTATKCLPPCNQKQSTGKLQSTYSYLPPTERFTLSGWLSSLYAAISANTSIGGAICTEEKFCDAIISCDHLTNSCTLQQYVYTLLCNTLCTLREHDTVLEFYEHMINHTHLLQSLSVHFINKNYLLSTFWTTSLLILFMPVA